MAPCGNPCKNPLGSDSAKRSWSGSSRLTYVLSGNSRRYRVVFSDCRGPVMAITGYPLATLCKAEELSRGIMIDGSCKLSVQNCKNFEILYQLLKTCQPKRSVFQSSIGTDSSLYSHTCILLAKRSSTQDKGKVAVRLYRSDQMR